MDFNVASVICYFHYTIKGNLSMLSLSSKQTNPVMVHLKLFSDVAMHSESFYGKWQIQNVITMGKNIVMLITIFISDVISLYYISIISQKTLREKLIVQNYYSYIFLSSVLLL